MIPQLIKPIHISSRLKEGVTLIGNTLFVCHASYEGRAYGVTNHELDGLSISHSAVIGTTKSIESNADYKKCFNDLIERLTKVSVSTPQPIKADRHELIKLVRYLDAVLGDVIRASIQNIIVDMSVFPKDRLWVVLDYLQRVNPNASLYVLYTEPLSYNTENNGNGWLSKGVKRLISIPGFNGQQSAEKRTLLVVIVGHEEERVQITIRNTEPDKVLLIRQGDEQYREDAPRLSDDIVNQLGYDYAHVIDFDEHYVAGSRDYLAVINAIKQIHQKHSNSHNIIVATNSTKLQSLGALIACRECRTINAIYAEPQLYNPKMTGGIGKIWGVRL